MRISYLQHQIEAVVSPDAVHGGTSNTISGIASLRHAGPGDLTFLGNPKYKAEVAASVASIILVPIGFEGEPKENQCLMEVANPSAALANLCGRIEQTLWPKPMPGVHPSAIVAPDAQVDEQATIGPLCVIESGARVGSGTHLEAHVFVGSRAVIGADCWLGPGSQVSSRCELRDRVRLHGGVIVGSDGFGYEVVEGRHAKVPQVGTVLIEEDVEIGANSTIDRARFSRTVIGQGTKIDNLVQVGHNVLIGQHCILCAQVGIAGSTTLEDYVVLGGQAGVSGHITLARGTQAAGRAGITSDTEPGVTVSGFPAMPYHLERRLVVLQRRLPELFKRVDAQGALLEGLKKTSA